jgi:hypothetical protein
MKKKKKKPRTQTPVRPPVQRGQELWENGRNGCFFNVVLALLLAVKAWEPNIDQVAENCCPLLREMLACVPEWDPSEVQRNRPTERVGVWTRLNQNAQALREQVCVWFNSSDGARGHFGGPHGIWKALFNEDYSFLEEPGVTAAQAPIALPNPAELTATVETLGCPLTRHLLCSRCRHKRTVELSDTGGGALLPIARNPKAALPLSATVLNLLTGISKSSNCVQTVPVVSSSLPGAIDTAKCNGERTMSFTDAAPGRFFALWFEDIRRRERNNRCMPLWEPVITLPLRQGGGNQEYRVVALLACSSESRDHLIARVLAPDHTWWCYDGLANGHCSVRIPDVEQLTTLDFCILFHAVD